MSKQVSWAAYMVLLLVFLISSFSAGLLVMGLYCDLTVKHWQQITKCMSEEMSK